MAIRPVDLQLLIQKASEANRTEHTDARRPDIAHQQFSQVMQKHVDQEMHQVLQTHKTEQEAIEKDGEGKNKYERRKKKKNGREEKRKPSAKGESTSMFDVSV